MALYNVELNHHALIMSIYFFMMSFIQIAISGLDQVLVCNKSNYLMRIIPNKTF